MPSVMSIITCIATAWVFRPTVRVSALSSLSVKSRNNLKVSTRSSSRLFSSSSPSEVTTAEAVKGGISRLSTLQSLLFKYGAPGSQGCMKANDLKPVTKETPELVASLSGTTEDDDELNDLHPHLFPIAKSSSTNNYICALRRAYADDASYQSSTNEPWPIVEATLDGPGMRLLSLNSEHIMRRIACEVDSEGKDDAGDIIATYNDGLGQGLINDKGLDAPYESGSVEKLGYGVDKYVLLRVGPFPDLYEAMASQHKERGDEESSLIAAETANGKFTGFGSTFASYAKLLSTFPNREEESRDAARMCLRIPIPSACMTREELADISKMAQLADESDSTDVAIEKLRDMYEKYREQEQQEDPTGASGGKTAEQIAIDEANYLLDTVALTDGKYGAIRQKLGDIYHSAGRDDMAMFVDPSHSTLQ